MATTRSTRSSAVAGRGRRRPRRPARRRAPGGARRRPVHRGHARRRRGRWRGIEELVGAGAAAQPPGAGRDPSDPRGVPRACAQVAVFDTAFFADLPDRRRDVRPGPASSAERRGHPAVRHARHQSRVRRRRGSPLPRAAAGRAATGRAAPRQRRLGRGDPRRQTGGHVHGADAARGAGDGHPQRRRRPRRAAPPAAPRPRRRRARGPAAPPVRPARAGRSPRPPRPAEPRSTTATRRRGPAYRGLLPPAPQVRRRLPGRARRRRRGRLHRRRRASTTPGCGEDALSGLAALGHRGRPGPQPVEADGPATDQHRRLAGRRCSWCRPTRRLAIARQVRALLG